MENNKSCKLEPNGSFVLGNIAVHGQNCPALYQALCEAHFFVTDLNLYLDTHPCDQKAIALFQEACQQYKCCKEAFEKACFPVNPCGSCQDDYWNWLCGF